MPTFIGTSDTDTIIPGLNSTGDPNSPGAGDDSISGLGGADSLSGGGGSDTLAGGADNDTLAGGDGNDILDGGAGADRMVGGAGNDRYVVGLASDVVVEAAGGGSDTVTAYLTYTLPTEVEALVLGGGGNLNGTGNALANSLTGNGGNNLLDGGGANDTLTGGAGADTLIGAAGNDSLNGGADADFLAGLDGTDQLFGGAGTDSFFFRVTLEAPDTVLDFTPIDDRFLMQLSGFDPISLADLGSPAAGTEVALTGLVASGGAARFITSATGAATAAAGQWQFIQNSTTGTLTFDSNGIAAGGISILAYMATKPVLTAADIVIIT